jgi:hypothetical protein
MADLSVTSYLSSIRSDIFKILPMKEQFDAGEQVYLKKYVDGVIINLLGGLNHFEFLGKEKKYIYAITNLRYLINNDAPFSQWRRVVLSTVNGINSLYLDYGGELDE